MTRIKAEFISSDRCHPCSSAATRFDCEAGMRVGIVGCGLIGNKRLKAIGKDDRLVAAADSNLARAGQLASFAPAGAAAAPALGGAPQARAVALSDWRELVKRDDVDLVVVATTNDQLAPVTLAAIQHGKHVLVEK